MNSFKQRVAGFLVAHSSQVQLAEKAAITGAAAGFLDASTRGLSGEALIVSVAVGVLRALASLAHVWAESYLSSQAAG